MDLINKYKNTNKHIHISFKNNPIHDGVLDHYDIFISNRKGFKYVKRVRLVYELNPINCENIDFGKKDVFFPEDISDHSIFSETVRQSVSLSLTAVGLLFVISRIIPLVWMRLFHFMILFVKLIHFCLCFPEWQVLINQPLYFHY